MAGKLDRGFGQFWRYVIKFVIDFGPALHDYIIENARRLGELNKLAKTRHLDNINK